MRQGSELNHHLPIFRSAIASTSLGMISSLLVSSPSLAAPSQAKDPAAATAEAASEITTGPALFSPHWWSEHLGVIVSEEMLATGGKLIGAILLFLAGWLAAKFIAWMVFSLLCKTDLDDRLADKLGFNILLDGKSSKAQEKNLLERGVARIVFWMLMALVIVGVLDFAGLEQAARPIQTLVHTVMQAIPMIGKAILIFAIAYVAALILSKVVTRALGMMNLDDRFAQLDERDSTKSANKEPSKQKSFSQAAGQIIFWLVMVLGLAGAFEALQIDVISGPLGNILDTLMNFLPALGMALLIAFGGYILSKLARVIVTKALESIGFDQLVKKAKLDSLFGHSTPSRVAGWLVMAFILIQTVIASLHQVGLETLSQPMTSMMAQFWALLPALATSILFVVLGVFLGRLLRDIAHRALESMGFDRLIAKLGFAKIAERSDALAKPSGLVAYLLQFAVVLLAIVQALQNLSLATWAGYVDTLLVFVITQVVVALIIIALGFALANYVRDLILARGNEGSGENSTKSENADPNVLRSTNWLAEFSRYAVLVFAFTMAVHQLGVAEDFVLLSFALLFGALCLAGALAFGLGARDVAGDIVKDRYRKSQTEGTSKTF